LAYVEKLLGKVNKKQSYKLSYTMMTMSSIPKFIALGSLLSLLGPATGQGCACSPASYEFTFDMSLTCPPVDISPNGVKSTYCAISQYGGPDDTITDLVPVRAFLKLICVS
jgi:hypothetical protein